MIIWINLELLPRQVILDFFLQLGREKGETIKSEARTLFSDIGNFCSKKEYGNYFCCLKSYNKAVVKRWVCVFYYQIRPLTIISFALIVYMLSLYPTLLTGHRSHWWRRKNSSLLWNLITNFFKFNQMLLNNVVFVFFEVSRI